MVTKDLAALSEGGFRTDQAGMYHFQKMQVFQQMAAEWKQFQAEKYVIKKDSELVRILASLYVVSQDDLWDLPR